MLQVTRCFQNRDGFTLIELLIVVAVLGILSAIAVPNFQGSLVRTQVARTVADLKQLSTSLEQYYIDHQSYPPSPHPLINPSALAETWRLTTPVAYISRVPPDPFYAAVPSGEDEEINPLRGGTFGIDCRYLHYLSDRLLGEFWLAFSYGPDQDMEMLEVHYNVTNGTISNGDIYQVGYPRP